MGCLVSPSEGVTEEIKNKMANRSEGTDRAKAWGGNTVKNMRIDGEMSQDVSKEDWVKKN